MATFVREVKNNALKSATSAFGIFRMSAGSYKASQSGGKLFEKSSKAAGKPFLLKSSLFAPYKNAGELMLAWVVEQFVVAGFFACRQRLVLAEFWRSTAPRFTSISEPRSRTSAGRYGRITVMPRSFPQCARVPDIKFTNRAVELTPSLLRALRN